MMLLTMLAYEWAARTGGAARTDGDDDGSQDRLIVRLPYGRIPQPFWGRTQCLTLQGARSPRWLRPSAPPPRGSIPLQPNPELLGANGATCLWKESLQEIRTARAYYCGPRIQRKGQTLQWSC